MTAVWVILGLVVLTIVYLISLYNKIVAKKEQVKNSEKQISIQLDRRGKIFDNLINTVKKAMDYEKSALKEIIELRQKAVNLKSGGNPKELKAIEEQMSKMISSGELSSSFNLTVEAYPELKANDNMLHFQEEIVNTENKLSYAKQSFNDSIEDYNATIQSFPENVIVGKYPKLKEEFEYWTLSEEKIEKSEEQRVEF